MRKEVTAMKQNGMLVCYVNINTPAYLKCTIVVWLVNIYNRLVQDRMSYALHNGREFIIFANED